MKIKILTLICILLCISSCVEKKEYIYYTFGSTTITRVDRGNELFFYYGKYNDTLPDAYIKASYSGYDGLVRCYLCFKDNGSVEIINLDGEFVCSDDNPKMKLKQYENNIEFIRWNEHIKGKYDNVIEILNISETEKTRNNLNNSNVKAVYPK